MAPSATSRSYASTTVDFDTPSVSVITRIDGTRAPGISERLAMRSRNASITTSTRVRDDAWFAGLSLLLSDICTAPRSVQFARIVLIRSLHF
jgi:hypothetical protein